MSSEDNVEMTAQERKEQAKVDLFNALFNDYNEEGGMNIQKGRMTAAHMVQLLKFALLEWQGATNTSLFTERGRNLSPVSGTNEILVNFLQSYYPAYNTLAPSAQTRLVNRIQKCFDKIFKELVRDEDTISERNIKLVWRRYFAFPRRIMDINLLLPAHLRDQEDQNTDEEVEDPDDMPENDVEDQNMDAP